MKLNQIKPLSEAAPIVYFGKTVDPKDLTATFTWNDVKVPIGKFDPEAYAQTGKTFQALPWNELKAQVVTQLDLSKMLTDTDLGSIDQLDVEHFVDCITDN